MARKIQKVVVKYDKHSLLLNSDTETFEDLHGAGVADGFFIVTPTKGKTLFIPAWRIHSVTMESEEFPDLNVTTGNEGE